MHVIFSYMKSVLSSMKEEKFSLYSFSEPCERLLGPQKIQMGPFNISLRRGPHNCFRSECCTGGMAAPRVKFSLVTIH